MSSEPADVHPLGTELRELAADLARRAGLMIAAGRRTGAGDVDTKSSATDMVTEFDRRSEEMIVGEIRTARPDDGIIGEEGTADSGTSGVHWLIDPIDGTTNFFYGLAGYNVSIAACDEHGAFAAAVYVPATNEMFSAERGRGATVNGEPTRCSTTADLSSALVATGFSYHADNRRIQIGRLQHILGEVRDIRRLGAAAADLCYVAAGRVDVYFEEHLGPWDLAAGQLIAIESGCLLGDFSGAPVRPAQVLASNPALFEPMQTLIAQADRLAATVRLRG
ncbi:MAG: inositol monophosphatase family protein [Ilumatobacteraceae bacterium]